MNSDISQQLYNSALVMAYLSGPILGIAAVIGFIIALLQAATQIQDQTLPQVVKIFAISTVVVLFGAALFQPMLALTENLFVNFSSMTN